MDDYIKSVVSPTIDEGKKEIDKILYRENMNPIDQLNEYREHLNDLMDNPQFDNETWHMAVTMACNRIGDMAKEINRIRTLKFFVKGD